MMNELLFENNIEKEALENLLALNRVKKCDNIIEKYSEEIKEQNDIMMDILKDENIDESYIEKIHKYKLLLNNMTGENSRINELNIQISDNEARIIDFQNKLKEIELSTQSLKNELFETNDPSRVIECQNEIENNNVRTNDLNDILNQLISDNTPLLIEKEYLTAKNSDFDFNIPNYNKQEIKEDLEHITNDFNIAIEKLDLPIRENIEFCQKKINNRELEIEKYNQRKKEIIDMFPNSIKLDVDKAYEDIRTLLEELDLSRASTVVEDKNIFDEPEEVVLDTKIDEEDSMIENHEEPIKEEKSIFDDTPEIKDEMSNLELDSSEESVSEEPKIEEASKTENDEEPIKESDDTTTEKIVPETATVSDNEVSDEEAIESVSYVLSDGESFMNIAEKVYPSKDNWEAIYYFNKDAIDKYLVSNGIMNDFETIKELANDTSLFTGIKLEIPTDYNYKK